MITVSHFKTTIDSAEWTTPREVYVDYAISGDEILDLTVEYEDNTEAELSDKQKADLIEEIWDDVRQGEDYV